MSDLVSVTVSVPAARLTSLYAFLASGAAPAAVAMGNQGSTSIGAGTQAAQASAPSEPTSDAPAAKTVQEATSSAPSGDGERDAAGVLWSADKHASTKGKTKAGLWRMKVGVTRPEGEGEDAIQGNTDAAASPLPSSSSSTVAPADDDEFAAFRAAASQTAPASAPAARTWADADLSKLCNQAALKSGNPENVKGIIAKYVPEGEIPHSRNIAPDEREDFAQEVEATFGFQYAA